MKKKKKFPTPINLLGMGVVYFLLFSVSVWVDSSERLFRFPPFTEKFYFQMIQDMGLGVVGGLLVVGLTLGMVRFLPAARELTKFFYGILGSLKMKEILLISIFSALGEEFFFRGILQPLTGIFLSSLFFGVLHMGPTRKFAVWSVFAVLVGFGLGGIYAWTKNLLTPVSMHFTINAVNLFLLQRSGNSGQSRGRGTTNSKSHPEVRL